MSVDVVVVLCDVTADDVRCFAAVTDGESVPVRLEDGGTEGNAQLRRCRCPSLFSSRLVVISVIASVSIVILLLFFDTLRKGPDPHDVATAAR